MKILALEFSSSMRSVALADGARVVATAAQSVGRHTLALALIDEALARAGWRPESVEIVAVGLGPGSYTGIRMAIALAQGWQLACGTPLVGRPSIDALIHQARTEGLAGPVAVAIDAQRGEFYLAGYIVAARQCELVEPLHVCTRTEIQTRLAQGACVVGPDLPAALSGVRPMFPQASTLAQLVGLEPAPAAEHGALEPVYLRPVAFVKAAPARPLPA